MEIKKDISYKKSTKCQDVYTESQADYVLPDYMGDMRKILFTEATVRPSGRFAGGETVEISGVVVYNVIYLSSEGELSAVEFSSDYDYSVKCSGDNYSDSVAHTRVSNYAIRLIGPRKISARASLVGSVRLLETGDISVSGDAFSGSFCPETSLVSLNIRQSALSSVTEREYAEQLARLDGAISDEISLLYPTAELICEQTAAEGDSVTLSGRLKMSAILVNADEEAVLIEKIVPFEESVELEGADKMLGLSSHSEVCSVKASVNADENGCSVVLSVVVEYRVLGEGNARVEPISDGYMRDCATDNQYSRLNYTTVVESLREKGTHNAEIALSEIEIAEIGEIIFLTAQPKIERVEKGAGELRLLGEIKYSGVAKEGSGDTLSYIGLKFSSPFAVNVNTSCQNVENMQVEADVRAGNCSASFDKEKLYASCTLESTLTVSEEKECRYLSAMNRIESEKYEAVSSRITVYYPDAGDTLFSVAKRYHTSGVKLAGDNDISELVFAADNQSGSLASVKKLIIF